MQNCIIKKREISRAKVQISIRFAVPQGGPTQI